MRAKIPESDPTQKGKKQCDSEGVKFSVVCTTQEILGVPHWVAPEGVNIIIVNKHIYAQ